MFNLPQDLSKAKILICNDDGVHAEGIKVLEEAARKLSDNVWVVAPETEQSTKSHSLTINNPLHIKQLGEKRYAVDGTPADCILLALNHMFKDARPDLILSGINFGRNAGVDVTYSGTIAAAMEATLQGVPAIAFSQMISKKKPHWEGTKPHLVPVIEKLLSLGAWPKNVLMNVNFPNELNGAIKGMRVAGHLGGKTSDDIIEREGRWGDPYYWVGHSIHEKYGEDTDVAALEAGYISITPIKLDLTDYEFMAKMKKAL